MGFSTHRQLVRAHWLVQDLPFLGAQPVARNEGAQDVSHGTRGKEAQHAGGGGGAEARPSPFTQRHAPMTTAVVLTMAGSEHLSVPALWTHQEG